MTKFRVNMMAESYGLFFLILKYLKNINFNV